MDTAQYRAVIGKPDPQDKYPSSRDIPELSLGYKHKAISQGDGRHHRSGHCDCSVQAEEARSGDEIRTPLA